MADNTYKCKNCGSIMKFDVKSQNLKCPNCDTEEEITSGVGIVFEHALNDEAVSRTQIQDDSLQMSTFKCNGCGAEVQVPATITATDCPYCGAKYVLSSKQEKIITPDGVIPFKIQGADVKDIFMKWIKGRMMAPGKLKKMYESGGLKGIYIPYWTFDADVRCFYTADGGNDVKVEKRDSQGNKYTTTEIRWTSTSGTIFRQFDDITICATKTIKKKDIEAIEPFDTINLLEPYSPKFFSGFMAEHYTYPMIDAHKDAVKIMQSYMHKEAEKDVLKRYDHVRATIIHPEYRNETYKHVMVPIYMMHYDYQGKKYDVYINGVTGKIKGKYPKSAMKITAIVIAIILGLLLMGSWLGCFGNKYSKSDDYNTSETYSERSGNYGYNPDDGFNFDDGYYLDYEYDNDFDDAYNSNGDVGGYDEYGECDL